jgi:hypothetical protein
MAVGLHEGVADPPTERSTVGREERKFWGKFFLSNALDKNKIKRHFEGFNYFLMQ